MNALIIKIIKGIIIIFCTLAIALLVDICVWEICYGPWPYCNKKAELTYLGTAAGECPYFKDENGKLDPEEWKEKNMYTVAAKAIFASEAEWRHLVKNAALTIILILLSGKDTVMYWISLLSAITKKVLLFLDIEYIYRESLYGGMRYGEDIV